jgi:hypothetical protein
MTELNAKLFFRVPEMRDSCLKVNYFDQSNLNDRISLSQFVRSFKVLFAICFHVQNQLLQLVLGIIFMAQAEESLILENNIIFV